MNNDAIIEILRNRIHTVRLSTTPRRKPPKDLEVLWRDAQAIAKSFDFNQAS